MKSDKMSIDIIKNLPIGIICWYEFKKDAQILCFAEDSIINYLKTKSNNVTASNNIDETLLENNKEKFDYIILIESLSFVKNPINFLVNINKCLKKDGKLIIAATNRMGLNFFCGDKDPFTNSVFDSIDGYKNKKDNYFKNRYYAKYELKEFLFRAGFQGVNFFSALPSVKFAQQIYSHDIKPNENISSRAFPKYYSPQTVFLNEKDLYNQIIHNEMFHNMANAYLIECGKNEFTSDILQATTTVERGEKFAMATIVKRNKTVIKKAIFNKNSTSLNNLLKNTNDLKSKGILVVNSDINGDILVSEFNDKVISTQYLISLFLKDFDLFEKEIDKWYQLILSSSKIIKEDELLGPILENGYIDLVPVNAFYDNGDYIFFDQEFLIQNLPAKVILLRVLLIIYVSDARLSNICDIKYFFNKYSILGQAYKEIQKIEDRFYRDIKNIDILKEFWDEYSVDEAKIKENRIRINYSASDYQEKFIDILNNIENNEIVVFGAGNRAKQFIQIYKNDIDIQYIVDNNPDLWGTKLEGYEIKSPEYLKANNSKIIVCVLQYMDIISQLETQKISNYGVFNPSLSYKKIVPVSKSTQKKYKKGYVAGVFDMFHIGHLNILKKAKEECDYLIVGIVSNEGVIKYKNVTPVISENDRLEIIKSCRYVDEAFLLPLDYADSITAHKLYEFDCQFTGSDYLHNEWWLNQKKLLKDRGANLEFLPYTDRISTSKLKNIINFNNEK